MALNARIGRPDNNRTKLRNAIAALAEEQQRHHTLIEAQSRITDEQRTARAELADAETALRRLRQDEPGQLAYAYANQEALQVGQVIAEAEAERDHAQATLRHTEEIETALRGEIDHSERRLRDLRKTQHAALGEFLVATPQYQTLYQQLLPNLLPGDLFICPRRSKSVSAA